MMDQAGFDSLWMYETYFAAESFSRAGFTAALTEHCKIATGVVNPYTRHPGLIALGAATLDRLSGGRLILVMSSGGKEWTEGILRYNRRRPGSDLVKAVQVVRKLLAGEEVTEHADGFSIENAQLDETPLRPSIPIYLGAEREGMLKIVAQVADGVWLFQMPSTGYVRWACEHIKQARPDGKPVEIGSVFPLRITDDPKNELDDLKPWVAYYLSLPAIGEQYLERAGYETKILTPIRDAMKTQQLANPHDAFKAGNVSEAIKYVPDELVDDASIIGSVSKCRERLAQLEKAGLTFVALSFQTQFDSTMKKIHDILRG